MLEFCFMWGAMKSSAKSAYDEEGRRKYLSRAEGAAFIQHAAHLPRPRALFCLTIYYTGCRISEALALRRQDIDLQMKVISIRSLKKRERKEIRRIPAPDFLIAGLVAIVAPDADKVIWPFSRTTGWRIIKAVMEEAGISGLHATTKGLRHGFGVRGAMMRIPTHLIQNWMGHADPSTTAIYMAVKDDEERTLIEKMW
jgi:integrase/recombinase XerD